jgi:hypothetical protein
MLTFISFSNQIGQLETQSAIQQLEARQIIDAQRTEERRLRDLQGKVECIPLLFRKFTGHRFETKQIDRMALGGTLR